MRKQPPPTNVFAERAKSLRDDARFGDLFSTNADNHVTLTLWLLELEGPAGARDARLLWGWVVRARDSGNLRWSTQREKNWSAQNEDRTRCRHARLSLTATPAAIERLLISLGNGCELSQAATAAGVPNPSTFASLRLAATTTEVAERFVLGPVRFLTAGQGSAGIAKNRRPLTSPSDHSAFCAAVCRLHKPTLWHKIDASEPLVGGDDIARNSLAYLESETGLEFRGVDARRLGDIEWISAPATDLNENNYVDVTLDPACEENNEVFVQAFTVTVRPGPLAAGTPILLRCRLYENQDVVEDKCLSTKVGDAPLRIATPTHLSRFLITIWKTEEGSVWYEKDTFLTRQISIGMGLMGLGGTLSTEWSRAITKTYAKAKQRLENLNKISQIHYSTTQIGAESALEGAERDMKNFADGLFPTRSGAKFFEKGWFSNAGVEFVTWFRQQTEASDIRAFVLLDPFFDDVGLTEFFSRAKNTAVEYIAITNSQVASFDDTSPEGTKSSRRDRLLQAFSSLEPLFDSLNITVFDVNKQSSGPPATTQVFHDRYLLIYGAEAELLRGFHLSNSIQGATKKAPLLITPIPTDTLPKVAEYVAALKEGDSKNSNVIDTIVVEKLVSSADRRKKRASARPLTLGLDFFAELLGNAHHAALSWRAPHDTICVRAFYLFEKYGKEHGFHVDDWLAAESALTLQHAGLLSDSGTFIVTDDISANLPRFVERLASDATAFARWWGPFCNWRSRLEGSDDSVTTALAQKAAELLLKWQAFVINLPRHPPPYGTKGTPPTQETLIAVSTILSNFDDGLRIGKHFDSYRPHYGAEPRIQRTLGDIAVTSAGALVKIAEELVTALPTKALETANAPECASLAPVIAPLLSILAEYVHAGDDALLQQMLKSSRPSFRAIAGQSIIRRHHGADEIAHRLAPLPSKERLYVLAERVSDLRVEANRNNNTETAEVTRQLNDIYPVIVAYWPTGMTAEELKRTVDRLGGPGVGAWAPSTLNNVLAPLVTTGKLSWIDIAKLWGDILLDNLKKLESALERPSSDRVATEVESPVSSHVFYLGNDLPLSQAFAMSLVRLVATDRQQWVNNLENLAKIAGATLRRPFVRSRSYSAWAAARDILDWLSSIAGLVLLHGEQLPAQEKEVWRAARERDLTLVESVPAGHNSALSSFRERVSTALTNRSNA